MIRYHLLASVFKPGLFCYPNLNNPQFPPNLDTTMKLLVRKVNLIKIYILFQKNFLLFLKIVITQYYQAF